MEQELKVGYSLIDTKFNIIEQLGVGSTSSVYKVSHKNLPDNYFALKVLHPSLMKNETVAKRFQRELLASHTVNHPNIVRGFDFIRQGSILAYTMEFADAGSLRKYLEKNNKLQYSEAIKLAVQLAAGLGAIHQAGVIHRDLKPENVLLTKNGYYKISDFGIAKLLNSKTLTKQGEILGQVEYSSPEYVKDSKYDERSDIYSYGLIIYEAVTGKKAFESKGAYRDLLKRVNEKAPLPIELEPKCPSTLNALVQKCCELNPEDRFQSAEEIISFLYDNEKESKEHVLEVSSAHYSIISFNHSDNEWKSSLWKGTNSKKNKDSSNTRALFLLAPILGLIAYFVFARFI